MKSFKELEEENFYLKVLLKDAVNNGYHSIQCRTLNIIPTTPEKELELCDCWIQHALNYLNPPAPVEKPKYYSLWDGPPCKKCGHTAGAHSNGGYGMCSEMGCNCEESSL